MAARTFLRETIQEIRKRVPDCKVEVLIPDFRGDWERTQRRPGGQAGHPESQHGNGSAVISPGAQGRSLRAVS